MYNAFTAQCQRHSVIGIILFYYFSMHAELFTTRRGTCSIRNRRSRTAPESPRVTAGVVVADYIASGVRGASMRRSLACAPRGLAGGCTTETKKIKSVDDYPNK